MQLPNLSARKTSINMLNNFLGYNRSLRIGDGEFYDMKNLTADYFPVFAPRKKRGIITKMKRPGGMFGCKKLVYVDDNKLYYDESYVCDLKEEYVDRERSFAMMGAYLCIFPDKMIYNTYTEEISWMENEVTTEEPPTFSLCKLDGTLFDDSNTATSDTEPDKEKYKYWLDTSAEPVVLKLWSESASMWNSVGTTYVKVSATGIGQGFSQYDAVTFSGVDKGIEAIYNDYDFNISNILWDVGEDYLIIIGFINKIFINSKNITVKRTVPEMDFIAEMDNRIWGCSSVNHEIYACKQGDPKNWNCFMGLVSDSYAATVGTDGDFTGCVNYQGSVLFFKDNGFHRLYGSKPSNYELNWKPGRGVQHGSEKSLVVMNECIFYKSRDGINIYDGSLTSISQAFGSENYYDAVAGGYRNKYYVSMRNENYEYSLFVYDMEKKIWMKEDDTIARCFAYANGGLYMLNQENVLQVINSEKIYQKLFPNETDLGEEYLYPGETLYPGDIISGDMEDMIEWSATTGEMGLETPYNKYIKKFILRCRIETDAKLRVEVMYDSSDAWEQVMEYYCTKLRSCEIPIPVKRCDHMKLRLSGKGDVRVFSITKCIEEGSWVS